MKPERAEEEAHDHGLEEEAHHHRLEEEAYDHRIAGKVSGISRGISILELVLRMIGIFGTLGSAVAMGTTHETLPFSTQAFLFQAQYDDIPALRFVRQNYHCHEIYNLCGMYLTWPLLLLSWKVLCDCELYCMWLSCHLSATGHLSYYQE